MANNGHLVTSQRQVPVLHTFCRSSRSNGCIKRCKHIHTFTGPFLSKFAYASMHVRAQISGCGTNGNSHAKGRMKLSIPHIQHAHHWGRQWKITGDLESAEALLLHCPSLATIAWFGLAHLLAPSLQQLPTFVFVAASEFHFNTRVFVRTSECVGAWWDIVMIS